MKKKIVPTSTHTEWITLEEVMTIIKSTSRNGVKSFAVKHRLKVNSRTGRLLYDKNEIYEVLEAGSVRMGV